MVLDPLQLKIESYLDQILHIKSNDYGKAISAGIYLYQIQAGDYIHTQKMVLLK